MNKNIKHIVAVNSFVKRQVKGSGKTYSKTMSFKSIALHAEIQMKKGSFTEGYREGVRIIHSDSSIIDDFVCPFVLINEETQLISRIVKRNKDEEPYIQTRALNGDPIDTGKVDLILYRHDVLKENKENTTNAEWELVSINAIPKGLDSLPMGPVTMMRNQLCLVGGTKAFYASNEWAQSVEFYQKYIPMEPNNES